MRFAFLFTLFMSVTVLAAPSSSRQLTGSTIKNGSGILTLPTSSDTLVGRDTTDTLTNKTLSNATLTGVASGQDLSLSATLTVSTGLRLGVASDTTTTGSGADLTVTAPIVVLSNASLVAIRGINGSSSTLILKNNKSSGSFTLLNNTGAIVPANRILTGTGADLSVANGTAILLAYDTVNSRWQVIGGAGVPTLTASRAVATDGSGVLTASTTTSTELGYLSGVTSAIQTQLGLKAPLASPTFTGTVTAPLSTAGPVITSAGGVLSSEAQLAITRGGTGQATKSAAFDALSPMSASGDVIYGGTSGTGTRLAKGSDGQVLTLASGLPSWAAPPSGQVIKQAFLTAGTTWTSPAGTLSTTVFKVTLIGGGGGGGGAKGTLALGAPGGGGAMGIVYVSGLTASTAYTIAIGSGGAGGAVTPTNGSNGGNTTLLVGATTYTAGGGTGGALSTASTSTVAAGGLGGTATNCTINNPGQNGANIQSGTAVPGGAPGPWGGGAAGATVALVGGTAATGYGAAGSGAISGSATGFTGGNGAAGAILIEWVL